MIDSRVRDVELNGFRYKLSSEDLWTYDKGFSIDNKVFNNGVVVYEPIEVFDTYNPFLKYYESKIEKGTVIDYKNPYKCSKIEFSLLVTIHGLLYLNKGIGDIGIKNMASFVKSYFVNGSTVTNEEIVMLINNLKEQNHYKLLKEYAPDKFYNRYVFYSRDAILEPEVKRAITNKEMGYVLRRGKRKLIDISIDFLIEKDKHTKITNKRISSKSGLTQRVVSNALSTRQKRRIKQVDLHRYFVQEDVTFKFLKFIDKYNDYISMPIRDVLSDLNISQSYYYKFVTIIKNNT